jgi:DNA-directed RNA polymerase III subunit RPC11
MHFCPNCGALLLVEQGTDGMRFCCNTCVYTHRIKHRYSHALALRRKQVDDVLGGAAAWENVDKTAAKCPFCQHGEAYFMQIQIRSADEPMTTFYKCTNCMQQWND